MVCKSKKGTKATPFQNEVDKNTLERFTLPFLGYKKLLVVTDSHRSLGNSGHRRESRSKYYQGHVASLYQIPSHENLKQIYESHKATRISPIRR